MSKQLFRATVTDESRYQLKIDTLSAMKFALPKTSELQSRTQIKCELMHRLKAPYQIIVLSMHICFHRRLPIFKGNKTVLKFTWVAVIDTSKSRMKI